MSGAGTDASERTESPAGGDRIVRHATCLGCGCTCDDIDVVVRGERIVEARHACPLGVAWFGDGTVPTRALVNGEVATTDHALDAVARLLCESGDCIVYLAPELSCEAQRETIALADVLRATLDSVTSGTALPFVLASQERGQAGATLGEIRNRADVVVFWGVDPGRRYPRYTTRYAPAPAGAHVPGGRASRTVVAVDVTVASEGAAADSLGPADADVRVSVSASDEVAVLTALRALVAMPGKDGAHVSGRDGSVWDTARRVAPLLLGARYAVLVHDAEPVEGRDPARGDALLALAQALNGPTRCALSALRGGGNRTGAESVMTSQAGYPATIDFARGAPRYRPHEGSALARLAHASGVKRASSHRAAPGADGARVAVLLVGAVARLPRELLAAVERSAFAVIGPRASEWATSAAAAAIDTGIAGIHDGGTAVRMDEVPLRLGPSVVGPPSAESVLRQLHEMVSARVGAGTATGRVP